MFKYPQCMGILIVFRHIFNSQEMPFSMKTLLHMRNYTRTCLDIYYEILHFWNKIALNIVHKVKIEKVSHH